MGELAKEILPVNIEDELKQSYLDYAMSVIVGRALPRRAGWPQAGSPSCSVRNVRTERRLEQGL